MPLARDVSTVGGGTLMSRLLAFFRDAWIAALLGAGPFSEAFFAVLQFVNFFRRLLAEGALNSAFIPIWFKLREGKDGQANADLFTRRSLMAMFCITGSIALLVILLAPVVTATIAPGFDEGRHKLAGFFLAIAAPYIALAGLVAVIAAALNAEGRVGAVALSTALFNVVMLAALFLLLGERTQFAISTWLIGAVVAAASVQLGVTAVAWLTTGKRLSRAHVRVPDQTFTFFTRAAPGLIAAGIPQLKLIAAAAVASSSPAAVAWLYYANRLYELPLGVASIAIAAVIVPHIANSLRAGAADSAAAQSRAFELALGLALPATTGFAVLAEPIASGLFQRGAFGAGDTAAVAAALTAICAGLPGHVLDKVFGAVSFAHEDTHTPMLTALASLATAIVLAILLFPHFGHVGVAAAIAISGWVGASLLGIILYQRCWLRLDPEAGRNLLRILLATAVMGGIVIAGSLARSRLSPALATSSLGRIAALAILVPLGGATYVFALEILGVTKIKDLIGALRGRD